MGAHDFLISAAATNSSDQNMPLILGLGVVLFAAGAAGTVRYIGRGWPWYVSALVAFVLFWPGIILLSMIYSSLGLGAMAIHYGTLHSLFGVTSGAIVMSSPLESSHEGKQ
jgi:hypothetical protein